MENQNSLFRQKSLEKISSPEEMHDYMRVTSPRLWMLLTAIMVLVAGFIIYAACTTLETTIDIKVYISSYETTESDAEDAPFVRETVGYASIPIQYKDSVQNGKTVRIGEINGTVSYVGTVKDEDTIDVRIDVDDKNGELKEGDYDAALVIESTTPISFLWDANT